MTVPILISAQDARYSEKLVQWLLLHPETGFHPVQEQNPGDATLLSNQHDLIRLGDVRPDGHEKSHFIRLADRTMLPLTMDETVQECSVDKYQPMPALFSAILRIATTRGWISAPRDRRKHPRLTLIVQLSGASYRQPIGQALSAIWSKKANTLFLGMDPAGNADAWFPETEGTGLSRLAYHLQATHGKLDPDAFLRCLGRETSTGIHYLRQAEVPQDAARLTSQSLEAICETAGECGFEEIICDAGFGLAGRNLDWMGLADICCLVCSTERPALLQAEASARLLSAELSDRHVREATECHWIFVGETGASPLPLLPEKHARHLLPEAYPVKFPTTGWAMQPLFVDRMAQVAASLKQLGGCHAES